MGKPKRPATRPRDPDAVGPSGPSRQSVNARAGETPPTPVAPGDPATFTREVLAGFDHLMRTGGLSPVEGEEVVLDGFRARPSAGGVPAPPSARVVAARMRGPTFLDALSPAERRERVPDEMETSGAGGPRRSPPEPAAQEPAPQGRRPRRPAAPASASPGARLPWEAAARDFPAVLARVRAGETVLLTEGDRVIAQVAPPPPPRRPRPPRPRPVFGALAHLLPEGADLGHLDDPLPEAELRAWEGDADRSDAADAGEADQGGVR